MIYLLIFVVILVALSPLLSMMPSRRQRELAGLRQAAASAGLFVSLEPDREEGGRVYYGCRRQRGDTVQQTATLRRADSEWVLCSGDWPTERLESLSSLPEAVMEVREDGRGVGIFWDERGSVEDVDSIARVLRQLMGRRW